MSRQIPDKKETVPLALLIEDSSIYPRHAVDDDHIRRLADALGTGAILPPPVVDAKTLRIVDGWHRVRAYRRVVGDTAAIDVILRTYPSEADLIADAVAQNATHGRRLDRIDQIRCIDLLSRAGLDQKSISVVLKVPEQKVQALRVRIAVSQKTGEPIPLKRSFVHLSGLKLSPLQEHAHDIAPGSSLLLTARQLRLQLEARTANPQDQKFVEELRLLRAAIDEWLANVAGVTGNERVA